MKTEQEINKIISSNLTYYRKKAGLTQQELAEKLNYSDKSISKWERNEGMPDLFVLEQLSEIYGLQVNDFFSEGKKEKIGNRFYYKIIIMFLAFAIVEMVATILFTGAWLFKIMPRPWMFFIYSIPVLSIVAIVFVNIYFKKYYNIISTSCLIWSLALSLQLSIKIDNDYAFYFLAIPVQVFFILFYALVYRKKKEHEN